MKLIRTEDAAGQVLCHDITQIIPGEFKGARFRKGHIIQPEDIPVLLSIGKENLYVWEKKPGILHEDEAAALLYKAAAGKNIHGTEPKEGKIELIADCDGLLTINREALLAVNRTPQMMIATIHGDLPVKKGQKLAGTRIIPLVIEQEKMDAMQAAAGSEPILNVLPMQAKKFAVITTGSEVFKGRIEDKFTPILVGKLAEYGCEMTFHKVCDDDPAGITAAILEAKEAGCELIFTTGGMSVDPDDRTPLAIRNTGADIVTYGAPVLPGAMFLVSYLDGVPVCGLPGCVMYAKRTIFDLLLPRLLADDAITAEDIARLGEGGLCLGCAECHWPNCGFGHCCFWHVGNASPFGRGVTEGDGEGKPGALKPPHSDKQTLCLSDTIAMSGIRRQHPRPLRRSRASSPKGRASGVTGSLTHKTKNKRALLHRAEYK